MSFVLIDKPRPHVALVTLNRPERMNAMAFDVMIPFREALEEVSHDNDTRVVVITGAGRRVLLGRRPGGLGHGPEHRRAHACRSIARRAMELLDDVILALRRMHQPVIGAINGAAIGGGFCLRVATDIRIASEPPTSAPPGINNGLTASELGISYLLPRRHRVVARVRDHAVGPRRRRRRGRAHRPRVADRARPTSCSTRCYELAERIIGFSRVGVEVTKRMLWSSLDAGSLHSHMDARGPRPALRAPDHRELRGSRPGPQGEARARLPGLVRRLLLVLAVVLGACGGSDGGSSNGTAPRTPALRTTTPRLALRAATGGRQLGYDLCSTFHNPDSRLTPKRVAGMETAWTYEAPESVNGAPAVAGDRVYVLAAEGLVALDADERDEVWKREDISGSSSPTLAGGVLYVLGRRHEAVGGRRRDRRGRLGRRGRRPGVRHRLLVAGRHRESRHRRSRVDRGGRSRSERELPRGRGGVRPRDRRRALALPHRRAAAQRGRRVVDGLGRPEGRHGLRHHRQQLHRAGGADLRLGHRSRPRDR